MPPEHSPAWLAGVAFGGVLLSVGLGLEYADAPHGRHVGALLAALGIVTAITMLEGYRRHYRRMTSSPLIIRQRECCEQREGNLWHQRLEVFNTDDVYTVDDVELHVAVVGDQWSQKSRLLKWVGESPSKRNIAAGESPHFELAGIFEKKPYFVFWPAPGSPGRHPTHISRDHCLPGNYEVTIVIRSERRPATHRIRLSFTDSAIEITFANPVDRPIGEN